jgi:hypothetical protein
VTKKQSFFFFVALSGLQLALLIGPIRRLLEGSDTSEWAFRLIVGCMLLAFAIALAVLTRPSKRDRSASQK